MCLELCDFRFRGLKGLADLKKEEKKKKKKGGGGGGGGGIR